MLSRRLARRPSLAIHARSETHGHFECPGSGIEARYSAAATAGRSQHKRGSSISAVHIERTEHQARSAMFPQVREEVWSGTGSNCRPSAFQRACTSAVAGTTFPAISLLTCINGLLGLTKPYYQPCRLVPDKTVLSVGFLWGTPFQTDGCGDSVGIGPRTSLARRAPGGGPT